MDNNQAGNYEILTIRQVFKAPLQAVWDAWTKPERFAAWWSPEHFTIPVCELDPRPGGVFRVDMQGPDGTLYPSTGVFKEVVKLERLSFTSAPLDKDGNKLFEVLQTVVFTEKGEETELEVIAQVVTATAEAAPYLAGMEPGLRQALGKLDDLLVKPG